MAKKVGPPPPKKGEVRNPRGGKALNKEVRRIRSITREEIASVLSVILENNIEQLKAIVNNPDSPGMHVWIATIALRSIREGDYKALDVLLSRIIGRPTIHFDATSSDGSMTPQNTTNVLMVPFSDPKEHKKILGDLAAKLKIAQGEE